MNKILRNTSFLIIIALTMGACNSATPEKNDGTDSDINAARGFIQAALKGNFDQAKEYMLRDSENVSRLDAVSRIPRTPDEKQGLWDASINIHGRKLLNDSTSIIIYSNSFYKDKRDTLKLIKQNDQWLVDFKYLFEKN